MRTLVGAALLSLVGMSGHAAVIGADADAYIQGGNQANGAHGSSTLLRVSNHPISDFLRDSGDTKTYIRFDLSGETETIVDAQLSLTFDSVAGHSLTSLDYHVLALPDALGDGWDEATITWNNAPGNDPANYYNTPGFPYLGLLSYDPQAVSAGDTLNFSSVALDDLLNNQFNQLGADGLATIVIIAANEVAEYDRWASRENNTYAGPMLSYRTVAPPPPVEVIPLPASAWLLGAGVAGLMGLRRRRRA